MVPKSKLLLGIFILIAAILVLTYISFHRQIGLLFVRPLCPDCNIILISVDTLGANHLPCYGYDRNTAPNLCKFAGENIQFTHSYSNASWTLPSHFSIFTGLYPKHHGVQTFEDTLGNKTKTLTQFLKEEGYGTIFVGPTDDRTLPLDKGLGRSFDEVIRYRNPNSWKLGYKSFLENVNSGKRVFMFLHTYSVHDPYLFEFDNMRSSKRIFAGKTYPDIPLSDKEIAVFTKELRDFVVRKVGNNEKSEISKVSSRGLRLEMFNVLNNPKVDMRDAELAFLNLPPQDQFEYEGELYEETLSQNTEYVNYARDLYDEGIYRFDKFLPLLFDLLSQKNVKNRTLVIITSDHGEEFMEHGQLSHTADHLYNTTTTTPLIIYLPGTSHKKVDVKVQSIDILPTVLDLIGLEGPKNIDGIDLKPQILGSKDAPYEKYLVSEGPNDSISDGRFKLYITYTGTDKNKYELYDLKSDPAELNNIASDSSQTVERLFKVLDTIIYKK